MSYEIATTQHRVDEPNGTSRRLRNIRALLGGNCSRGCGRPAKIVRSSVALCGPCGLDQRIEQQKARAAELRRQR